MENKPPASVGPGPKKQSASLEGQMRAAYEQSAMRLDEVASTSEELEKLHQEHAENIENLFGRMVSLRSNGVVATQASGVQKEPVVTANLIAAVVLSLLGASGVILTSDQTDAITQLVMGAFVLAPVVVNGVAAASARKRATWVPKNRG